MQNCHVIVGKKKKSLPGSQSQNNIFDFCENVIKFWLLQSK